VNVSFKIYWNEKDKKRRACVREFVILKDRFKTPISKFVDWNWLCVAPD